MGFALIYTTPQPINITQSPFLLANFSLGTSSPISPLKETFSALPPITMENGG